jgi:hypothetical protein
VCKVEGKFEGQFFTYDEGKVHSECHDLFLAAGGPTTTAKTEAGGAADTVGAKKGTKKETTKGGAGSKAKNAVKKKK